MSINRLLELHDLAKQESRKYDRKRFLFPQLMRDTGKHFTGIVGARGTGKTVLLRQYALEHDDAFYLPDLSTCTSPSPGIFTPTLVKGKN